MGRWIDLHTHDIHEIRKMMESQQRPAVVYVPTRPQLPPKHIGAAYAFWFFLGLFGGHHFYLGRTKLGVLYLLTFGLLGIGWFIDMFLLPHTVKVTNYNNGHDATMTPLRLGSS